MTLHQAGGPPASASTALAGAAIQPGRPAFEAEEKAPVSSSIPERPRDDDSSSDDERFEELIELGDEELDEREADHLEKEVEQSEPTRIAREGEKREEEDPGLGVAVPAAAEGTSALPVQAIVQGEEADGRNVAPKEERGRAEEETEERRLPVEEIGEGERKVVREQTRHEEEEEQDTMREGEAEIDLSEQLIDLEQQEENYR